MLAPSDMIRLASIAEESVVDGPGLRYVIFTQGCIRACPGCHNPQTHSFQGGKLVNIDTIFNDIKKNPLIRGVTFSGGEPFLQSNSLVNLAKRLKVIRYHLLSYTGFLFEELLTDNNYLSFLKVLDVIIDGPFILEKKSLMLRFRGSHNQRIIDVHSSLVQNKVILCPW